MEEIPKPIVKEIKLNYKGQYATTYTHRGDFALDRVKKSKFFMMKPRD
jgi:uncharacterized protein (DUF2249 family)